MKLVTAEQMRAMDRRTIEELGVPGERLMDRAGWGVACAARRLARGRGAADLPLQLVAGRGNNGGDVFAAARYLRSWGFTVDVWLAGAAEAVGGDARHHLERWQQLGGYVREAPEPEDWRAAAELTHIEGGLVVDGVLGTGLSGPARGTAEAAIRFINALGERNGVLAVDIPSGLDADTGAAEGEAVRADFTVTLGFPKRGLAEAGARGHVGSVDVADIGIPGALADPLPPGLELIARQDLLAVLKRRPRSAHKGDFGHVLIFAGAVGFSGAAAMAAAAAIRSGVGLVTVMTPASLAPVVASLVPEAMVHAGAETDEGTLSSECLVRLPRGLNDFDAVLIGPGMTTHVQTRRLVDRVLGEGRRPLVMDADALNVSANRTDVFRRLTRPVVLTPHPGEMARLVGRSVAAIQANRVDEAAGLAERAGVAVVLKGDGTLVAARGRPTQINLTGNPGMATGGMGDVLAGLLAGLLAQGLDVYDASRAAVWLHGMAADAVAWRASQAGMVAGDVIRELPVTFRELLAR